MGMSSDVADRKKVLDCRCNRGGSFKICNDFSRQIVKLGRRILRFEALIMKLGVSQLPDLSSELRSTRETIST